MPTIQDALPAYFTAHPDDWDQTLVLLHPTTIRATSKIVPGIVLTFEQESAWRYPLLNVSTTLTNLIVPPHRQSDIGIFLHGVNRATILSHLVLDPDSGAITIRLDIPLDTDALSEAIIDVAVVTLIDMALSVRPTLEKLLHTPITIAAAYADFASRLSESSPVGQIDSAGSPVLLPERSHRTH